MVAFPFVETHLILYRSRPKDVFIIIIIFYFIILIVVGFACNNLFFFFLIPRTHTDRTTCYRARALFIIIIFFIYFSTAFIKNLSTIDSSALESTGGREGSLWRGGNCFVRRPNKNYKTFIPGIIHDDDDNTNECVYACKRTYCIRTHVHRRIVCVQTSSSTFGGASRTVSLIAEKKIT